MFREEYYVLNTTGPGLVSRTLAEYPDAAKQVKVLFPENVCDSTNWHRFGTFGVHLWRVHGVSERASCEGAWLLTWMVVDKEKGCLRRA